jgi:hypothetical protein
MANKGAYAAIEIDDDDEVTNTAFVFFHHASTHGAENKHKARRQEQLCGSEQPLWNKTPRHHERFIIGGKRGTKAKFVNAAMHPFDTLNGRKGDATSRALTAGVGNARQDEESANDQK